MIKKALKGLCFAPPASIAPPVSHMVILLSRFEHLNRILLCRKKIWIIIKEQKRQASVFWGFCLHKHEGTVL